MTAQTRLWADTFRVDSSAPAGATEEVPYRSTEPLFGFDDTDTEQVNILRAAFYVAGISAGFYLLVVGLIIIL